MLVVVVVIFLAGEFSFIFVHHFVVVLYSFLFFILFVVVLHSFLLFICCCCCTSFIACQRRPSPFCRLSPSFYTHFILSVHRRVIRNTFIFILSRIFFHVLPRALRFFYPQAFFYLTLLLLTFLTQHAFIKTSLGASSSSLKFAGLHTDPQNTDCTHPFV